VPSYYSALRPSLEASPSIHQLSTAVTRSLCLLSTLLILFSRNGVLETLMPTNYWDFAYATKTFNMHVHNLASKACWTTPSGCVDGWQLLLTLFRGQEQSHTLKRGSLAHPGSERRRHAQYEYVNRPTSKSKFPD
jgi:hypothetical protein